MRGLTLFDAAFVSASQGLDPGAANYIAAVEAADGQALEAGVKTAWNNFFVNGKANTSLWAALDTYVPLFGARTLAGSLIPAKGVAPTNVGFVAGDYSRPNGSKGDGLNKYLSTNKNNNFYPQNNFHMSVTVTEAPTITSALMGARQGSVAGGDNGSSQIIHVTSPTASFRLRSAPADGDPVGIGPGFAGVSRTSSTTGNWRHSGNRVGSLTQISDTPVSINIHVFQRSGSGGNVPTDARLAGYTLGTALDLAALETLLTNLRSELLAAI